ncbi:hypothetical protein CAPN008_01200 [Capnocytophaga canis]|uniref:hypothetical protein n=1 Tax=Capnocytophaga canis TaxID=1848903 RepID=UPI001ACC3B8C|nr:hypothetical protein [Capnocytophaga canis]GIM60070.1 hypothetical protein CAPN008_01200 [Capnocytophaga canis]
MKKIKEIKKELNVTDADIANIFGYKTQPSYSNSSAKPRIEKAIEIIYNKIKSNQNMKTQINHLRSGAKNQILNKEVDYSELPRQGLESRHAGSPRTEWAETFKKIREENPKEMKIRLKGRELTLKTGYSLSEKSVWWSTALEKDFAEKFVKTSPNPSIRPSLTISEGGVIVYNGKNTDIELCPSLIEII